MSKDLTTAQRYKLIEEFFGSVLSEHGFTCSGSKKGVYWRKTEDGIYHYISAWRALRKPKYDIMVYAFHPSFDEDFEAKHPDDIGCPINGYLHSKFGVGVRTDQLFCKTREGFERDFNNKGKSMLLDHAVPFLSGIQNLSDLEPLITAPGLKKKLNKSKHSDAVNGAGV
jgi:hypothetical protein